MNEFLTWNARHIKQPDWLLIGFNALLLLILFFRLFYLFCKFIGWIEQRFFTVDEWELDDIDAEERGEAWWVTEKK